MSFDTVEDNRAFADKCDFPFDLLSDVDRMMGVEYGACLTSEDGFPRRISYLIDEDGVVIKAYAIVKPEEHPAEVLRDLEAR